MRAAMTILHLDRPRQWKRVIDHETFWIASLSAAVLAGWIFAFVLISQNNAFP